MVVDNATMVDYNLYVYYGRQNKLGDLKMRKISVALWELSLSEVFKLPANMPILLHHTFKHTQMIRKVSFVKKNFRLDCDYSYIKFLSFKDLSEDLKK